MRVNSRPRHVVIALSIALTGCTAERERRVAERELREAMEEYARSNQHLIVERVEWRTPDRPLRFERREMRLDADSSERTDGDLLTRAAATRQEEAAGAASQPAADPDGPTADSIAAYIPADYWKEDVFHQAGSEFKSLVKRDFWRGFKTSFWDVENAMLLAGTMGASIAIRESGVDDTVRGRVRGHRQLGEFDEPLQILGNPGTHFAGAGVMWLTTALSEDFKNHEVARKLTEALAVNGVTTMLLKVSANTRAPDGESLAWPSGHTSSAFTVAAVLNEYYGPWVGVPSIALAGLVGYQRIDSEVHDFSDVVFGAMLGYIVGSSIARDGKAQFPEVFGMKLVPYTDPNRGTAGLALMKQF